MNLNCCAGAAQWSLSMPCFYGLVTPFCYGFAFGLDFRLAANSLQGMPASLSDGNQNPPESSLQQMGPFLPQITEEFALYKCDHFVDIQLWPLKSRLDPRRWLANFKPEEMPFAISLLHSFLYFSEPLMDQMLTAAFQDLSRLIRNPDEAYSASVARWQNFVDSVIITCVRGENPNATDSGLKFLRMARQVLGINENRILSLEDTLTFLEAGNLRPIVFLDDFVGSGQQFLTTWNRPVLLTNRKRISFDEIASGNPGLRFYYCPLICTETGRRNIRIDCPRIILNPAHILPDCYNALADDSVLWRQDMREPGRQFIESVSTRIGIPDWRGFNGLGLALAFEHSVPDATLPMFHWKGNGWNPLIERK